MDQNLLTNSDLSANNNLDGEYEFLKALGLLEDDDEVMIGDDDANDKFEMGDDTEEEDDDDWWDPSKSHRT